jgi:starvation-inducible DNA-binding protein
VKTVYPTSKCVEQKEKTVIEPDVPMEHSEEDILKMIKKYHATLIVFSNMLKAFHYCVLGSDFYSIHIKLQDYYETIDQYIDDVAELLITEGAIPVLNLADAIMLSWIGEYSFGGAITCKQAMVHVSKQFDLLAEAMDELSYIIQNEGIAGLFGDHYLYYSKQNWMAKAYLQN